MIPSSLEGFSNAETEIVSAESGTSKYIIRGDLEEKAGERICPDSYSCLYGLKVREHVRHPDIART